MISALAIHDAVSSILPDAEVKIKWPNDILLNKRKTAGILIRNSISSGNLKSSIIGIGLNVNQEKFEPEMHGNATSLSLEGKKKFDLEMVLLAFLRNLEIRYESLRHGQTVNIFSEFHHKMWMIGKEVDIRVEGMETIGRIDGTAEDGRLLLTIRGVQKKVDVKEIKFLY